jgi:hypothetical protein
MELGVIVDLDRVRTLRKDSTIEVLSVWIEQVDLKLGSNRGGQSLARILLLTELARRVGLPDPEDVVSAVCLPAHVNVPAGVLPERGRKSEEQVRVLIVQRLGNREHVRVDEAVAVVGVDVPAEQARYLLVADDIATRDRATVVRSARMRVLPDRLDGIRRLVAGRVWVTSLAAMPAEVDTPARTDADRLVVDLLVLVLTDVADVQFPADAIEREAPRVSKAERPDLWLRWRLTDERVVRGHGVRV